MEPWDNLMFHLLISFEDKNMAKHNINMPNHKLAIKKKQETLCMKVRWIMTLLLPLQVIQKLIMREELHKAKNLIKHPKISILDQ